VSAGREANDQDTRLRVAKRRYGAAPVLPIAIGAAFEFRDLSGMDAQPGAPIAIFYFILEDLEQKFTAGILCGNTA